MYRTLPAGFIVTMLVVALGGPTSAQEKKCGTVAECAQRAVDVAHQLTGILKSHEEQMAHMKSELEALKQRSPLDSLEFFRSDQKSGAGGNWTADCPTGSQVISGYCQVNGPPVGSHGPNINIQNFGIANNGWLCLWRDNVVNPTVFAWCARKKS